MKRLNLKMGEAFNINDVKFGETKTDKILNFLTSFVGKFTTKNY